jgi:hypothetical protein
MTAKRTRRAAPGGTIAIPPPVSAAPAIADPTHPDAHLLAMCAEFERAQVLIDLWDTNEISDEDGEMFHDDWWAAVRAIIATRARTQAGIRAKAAVLAGMIKSLTSGVDPEADNELALSLAADIARVGARG